MSVSNVHTRDSGLSPVTVAKIKSIFQKYPEVQVAILYGSRALGRYRPGSDIDLTLKGNQLDLELLNRLRTDLDDLLLPYTFDLSNYNQIENVDLVEHIIRVGIQFWP